MRIYIIYNLSTNAWLLWRVTNLLLPQTIVDYFELTSTKRTEEILHLYLQEINFTPISLRDCKLRSNWIL
jgi:hypothetical protein